MRALKGQQGFSLIELLVALTIAAILAAVALPAYQQQVVKAQRTEAAASLMEAAQDLERCFTRYSAYDTDACAVATALEGSGITSEEGHYVVTGTVGAADFALTATPQGALASRDSKCKNFTLNQTGLRGISGTETDVDKCW